MKDNITNTYLYISWNPECKDDTDRAYFNSYMSVVRAMIHEEISTGLENVGDGGSVFSSQLSFEEVREKMKHHKFPYLIIDISLSIQTGTLDGFLTKTEIEKLKIFVNRAKEDRILSLQARLDKAVEGDDFEKAIIYRDKLNGTDGPEQN